MNISGKINLFVKLVDGMKGQFKVFNGSISSKDQEGKWINKNVRVKFAKDIDTTSLVPALYYTLNILEGFIVVDEWKDKNDQLVRDLVLFVQDCEIEEEHSLETKKSTAKKTLKRTK